MKGFKGDVLSKLPRDEGQQVKDNLAEIRDSLGDIVLPNKEDNRVLTDLLDAYLADLETQSGLKFLPLREMVRCFKKNVATKNIEAPVNSPYRVGADMSKDEIMLMLSRFQDFMRQQKKPIGDCIPAAIDFVDMESKTWLEMAIIMAGIRNRALLATGQLQAVGCLIGMEEKLDPIFNQMNAMKASKFLTRWTLAHGDISLGNYVFWGYGFFGMMFGLLRTLSKHRANPSIDILYNLMIPFFVLSCVLTVYAMGSVWDLFKSYEVPLTPDDELPGDYYKFSVPGEVDVFVKLLFNIQSVLDLLKKNQGDVQSLSKELIVLTTQAKNLLREKGDVLKSKVSRQPSEVPIFVPEVIEEAGEVDGLRLCVSDKAVGVAGGQAVDDVQGDESSWEYEIDFSQESCDKAARRLR